MRHHLSGRQLSRNSSHRHALLRSLSVSLLRHETIRTTIPKAKELRRVVEPLITLGKDDSDANRRLAFARLRDSEIVAKLFDTIGPRFKTRPGDNAPMALMQLVERSAPVAVEAAPEDKKAKKVEAPKVDKAEKKAKADAKKGREKAAKEANAAKAVAKKAAKKTGGVAKKKKAAPKKKKSSK